MSSLGAPCREYTPLNRYVNHPRLHPAEVEARRREARTHLEFVASLYRRQLQKGLRFVHEHPLTAGSWEEGCIQELLAHRGVDSVVGDMCTQGMRLQDSEGIERPVLKPTRWLSSSPCVLQRRDCQAVNPNNNQEKLIWSHQRRPKQRDVGKVRQHCHPSNESHVKVPSTSVRPRR